MPTRNKTSDGLAFHKLVKVAIDECRRFERSSGQAASVTAETSLAEAVMWKGYDSLEARVWQEVFDHFNGED